MRIEFTLVDDQGEQYHGAVELGPVSKPTVVAADSTASPVAQTSGGLPGYILELRNEGFFQEPRTPDEVHKKLSATYHCLPNRVQMALLRLQRRRELRKASKKIDDREQSAYVW